ncbi:hypothetical protein E4198_20330 [Streptomyces sp. RKND-216]|uniref:hypothetical protein n=1 Tax=Streptomyces sp. RKND-216 TaxID=2562581 RepID=UPI00109D8919|nr:hypothetical protein [Streptomyces sp. RKND-216]THA26700.1 hypothetical protein E4198_20330 [Streptomyces sp. RKND-216]
MDAVRVALLREVLAGTEWLPSTRRFAGSLRASVSPRGGGLLLVGTEEHEPWHLAAHLDDEAAWSGLPELSPTLVRHRVPPAAPAHLSCGLARLEAAGRNETLLVVAPGAPGGGLLERVHDARRAGATVLALEGGMPSDTGDSPGTTELGGMAHDALTADPQELDLDTLQHLVSAAAGEAVPGPGGLTPRPQPFTAARHARGFRDRLSRLAERLTAPPPPRW